MTPSLKRTEPSTTLVFSLAAFVITISYTYRPGFGTLDAAADREINNSPLVASNTFAVKSCFDELDPKFLKSSV